MCGICGFVNLDGHPVDTALLERMNRAMVHRGPDGEGVFIEGGAALAMRRLSIIDLEMGQQPMSNEDGTAWVVFNGEIYNSPTLRRRLEGLGHQFATRSDTETIVHAYEERGSACTDELTGMFAFAVLDLRQGPDGSPTLLLARDRVGIKPLFYYLDDRLLVFSSELTSLVQHPAIHRELEPAALRQYLAAGAVAAPLTMFRNVKQILPGERLILKDGRVSLEVYWSLPSSSSGEPMAEEDAAVRTRSLLQEVVRDHLLSDVPVGAFLSGGIDSSIVVALMARETGGGFPTFSIRFEEEGYDESPYARLVASRFGTEHHEFTVPNRGFDPDLLRAMVTHHGQPTADSSAIPTFLVSRLARSRVKVVLSGDGGDECFAGYDHYGWTRRIDRLYALPRSLRCLASGTALSLAHLPGLRQWDGLRRAANAWEASLVSRHLLPLEVLSINRESEIRDLLLPSFPTDSTPGGASLQEFLDVSGGDPVSRAQRFSFRYYLPDAYLAKVDRMSMASGLEVRVPFLDHRVVDFALSVPGSVHWRGGLGKRLLRRSMADLLPRGVFAHHKQGFSIPLHRWATRGYFDLAHELLGEGAVRRRGLFRWEAVRGLLNRCEGKTQQYRSLESDYRLSHRLFMLVALELWCQLYLDVLVDRPTETARFENSVGEDRRVPGRTAAR